MPESQRLKSSEKTRKRSSSNRTRSLRFYLYTVHGKLHGERKTLHVVCCHASDARAMVAAHQPRIDKLRVRRGSLVNFIAVGDHALLERMHASEATRTPSSPVGLIPQAPHPRLAPTTSR